MGELYALASAITWGLAVILFKKSGETVPPFALNLFRVVVSLVVFVPLLFITGQGLLRPAPAMDYLILALSGVIGIALSDTLFHRALNMVGAGIVAIVDCLYSPFVLLFAWSLLGEMLTVRQALGMILVIAGVIVASRHRPPPGLTPRRLVLGILLGAGAMATVSFAIVIAKPVLERHPVVWATSVRQIACVLVMLPAALLSPRRRRILSVFRPRRDWRYSVSGTMLGSCLALLFWIAGMKYAPASLVAILNQTSTIYVLIFATLFLREPFTRRKGLAAALAVAGILLVTVG
ncbi:MAG: DMT family transporter [Candidatus Krumholzibacteriota bacterium]|nr:DMT family transporter [Candidatus Krumholzibacteriota bacterium]